MRLVTDVFSTYWTIAREFISHFPEGGEEAVQFRFTGTTDSWSFKHKNARFNFQPGVTRTRYTRYETNTALAPVLFSFGCPA